jgi:hypothetical protein
MHDHSIADTCQWCRALACGVLGVRSQSTNLRFFFVDTRDGPGMTDCHAPLSSSISSLASGGRFVAACTADGVLAFLCGGGQPACPAGPGNITGVITAANVQAIAAQGVNAGCFDALINALGTNAGYVNVHTANSPNCEIRGQIKIRQRQNEPYRWSGLRPSFQLWL